MQRVKRRIREQLLVVMELLDARLAHAVEVGGIPGTETCTSIRDLSASQASLVEALKETRTVRDQSITGMPDDDAPDEAALLDKLYYTGPKSERLVYWPPDTCLCPACGEPGFAVIAQLKGSMFRPDPAEPDYAIGHFDGRCRSCEHEASIDRAAEVQLREEMSLVIRPS